MDLTWSIDEVARSTDEMIVRRRFDERNQRWIFILLFFFALVSVIAVVDDERRQMPAQALSAYGSVIAVILAFFILRDVHRLPKASVIRGRWRLAQAVRNHISASVLTYIAVQYLLLLGIGSSKDGWVAWVMTYPMFMLGFRMLVAELVLLHVFLFSAGIGMGLLSPEPMNEIWKMLIGAAVINAFSLGIELFASHRMRKEVVADWTDRRSRAREQIRMRDELQYARELQLSMLPECAPKLDWVDICSISIPATEVGGDYYDYFVDRERVALVCGDVAGHGMASGLVLSAIRSGFTLLRDSLTDPATVLRRLHDLVAETSRRRMLVTVSVVLLDRATRRATIASAGHPPVILRRASGSVETIDLFAPPLGVRLPVDIPQRQIDIAPGDVFVLHSDGIYETRGANDDVYGMDRLARVVSEHAGETAESLRDAIVGDVGHFRGKAEQDDDVTVVVCKVLA